MENNQNRNRGQNVPFESIQKTTRTQSTTQRVPQKPNNSTSGRPQQIQNDHQLPRTAYSRVPNQAHPQRKPQTPAHVQRVEQIRESKKKNERVKKPSKGIITLTTLLLAGLLTLTIIVNAMQPGKDNSTINSPEATTTVTADKMNQGSSLKNSSSKTETNDRIYELDEINPTYEFITWKGKQQLTIDDDSMKQIVQLALRDAVDFYYDLKAPNCSFILKDGKVTNTTGKENFLEKQMNWQYYMGRIYQEASGHIMVDFVNDIGKGENNPNGVFGSMPISTNNTLNEYFRDVFHVTVDFAKYDSVITEEDVAKVLSSKESAKAVTEKVYYATLKVIIDDIHKLKSMTKGHEDCYLPYSNMTPDEIMSKCNVDESLRDEVIDICNELKAYKGQYSPTLALAGLQATHLYGFSDVRSSMESGTFFSKYFNKEYIFKTFGNTDKIEETGLFYE